MPSELQSRVSRPPPSQCLSSNLPNIWGVSCLVLSTNAPVHQSNTSHVWTFNRCNMEQLLVFKALRVSQRVHQSTSQTTATRGQSIFTIENDSLFLGFYKLVDECTSPPSTHGLSTTRGGGGKK